MAVRKKKRGISVFSVLLLLVLMGIAAALALFRPKGDPAQTVTEAIAKALPAQEQGLAGIDAEIADEFGIVVHLGKVRMRTEDGEDFLQAVEYLFLGHTRATFMLPVRLKSSVRTVTFIMRWVEGRVSLTFFTRLSM